MPPKENRFANERVSNAKVKSVRAMLAKMLWENRKNNYPNIDRTPTAIFKRNVTNRDAQASIILSGIKPTRPGTLEQKCIQHWIEGNLSIKQYYELIKFKYKAD